MRAIILDDSHWEEVDYSILKANGIVCAVHKATQGDYKKDATFDRKCNEADGIGIINGAYHWCDPLENDKAQAQLFLDAIQDKNIALVGIDIEQWWADWIKWGKMRRGEISVKDVPKLSSVRISENAKFIAEYIIKNRGDLKFLPYTSQGFIHGYALSILKWLYLYDLWIAQYVVYPDIPITKTWDEIRSIQPNNKNPAMPQGCSNWKIWQWTAGRIFLPGIWQDMARNRLKAPDLNVFNGTEIEFYEWLQRDVSPISPLELSEEVFPKMIETTTNLNIRTSPKVSSDNKIGAVKKNVCFEALGRSKEDENWIEVKAYLHGDYVKDANV